jgi:hypothetical protein
VQDGQPEGRSLPAAVRLADVSGLLSAAKGAGGRSIPVAAARRERGRRRRGERVDSDGTTRTWPAAAREARGQRWRGELWEEGMTGTVAGGIRGRGGIWSSN